MSDSALVATSAHRASTDFAYRRVLPTAAVFAALYAAAHFTGYHINAVVLTILLMITLCLLRVPVAIALITAAMLGSLHAGLSLNAGIAAFNDNLLIGAQVGLTYVMVGAFAVALSRSGLLELLADAISARLGTGEQNTRKGIKWVLFSLFIFASLISQNLVPVHIAFIPILIPPLLGVLDRLQIDRRAVACVLACSMSASYLLLPTGFGAIFLHEILLANVNRVGEAQGLTATAAMAPKAMLLPVMGLVAGLLVAVFISYRRPRNYAAPSNDAPAAAQDQPTRLKPVQLVLTLAALAIALFFQLKFDSLLLGAMSGFLILGVSGIFRWQEQDDVFTDGLRMMAQIAVIITIASGFAGVLSATGEIDTLVAFSAKMIGDNMALGAAAMLIVGLFITIGFGDSFASVPILAPIYVPLALTLGFDPLAVIALLGASAALGDAGSPASTITLGATAGLNADGQHDHIRDSVIPTFLHCNIGMLVFAWVAAMVL